MSRDIEALNKKINKLRRQIEKHNDEIKKIRADKLKNIEAIRFEEFFNEYGIRHHEDPEGDGKTVLVIDENNEPIGEVFGSIFDIMFFNKYRKNGGFYRNLQKLPLCCTFKLKE
jgi:hypothetical protein